MVFIKNDVSPRHDLVRRLVDNGWLHLFRNADDGSIYRREGKAAWKRVEQGEV